MALLILWLICGVICAVIAGAKNRSAVGWFFLGCILGVIGVIIIACLGDPTKYAQPPAHTVIIQNAVGKEGQPILQQVPLVQPPQPKVDTSRWSQRDREAYEARQMPGIGEPRLIDVTPSAKARPRASAYDMQPAIVALKVLAEAGNGFDATATEEVMSYLEVENGDEVYSRKEAAALVVWMKQLPSDDATIREALNDLVGAVTAATAFLAAAKAIAGNSPTEKQIRWLGFLAKRVQA